MQRTEVAGEGAHLDGAPRADEARQQGQQRALLGRRLHQRHRPTCLVYVGGAVEYGIGRGAVGDEVGVDEEEEEDFGSMG